MEFEYSNPKKILIIILENNTRNKTINNEIIPKKMLPLSNIFLKYFGLCFE
jgi:hypothetical protein